MTACQPTLIYLTPHDPTVGAGLLAKAALQATQLDCVHIHFCSNGHLGFRLTAGHFGKEPQSNQRALAPPLGTSLRLGVPVIRP